MITELADNLFLLSEKTMYERQGSYNSFLIRGDRNLLIDAGRWESGKHAVVKSHLKELGVDRDSLDFFVTHMHVDHAGGVEALAGRDSVLYLHKASSRFTDISAPVNGYALCGLSREVDSRLSAGSLNAAVPQNAKLHYLDDGDILSCGRYSFHCVHSPGHADEHICLYEENRKMLFSGDCVIEGTASYVQDIEGEISCLDLYMQTLDKLDALDVKQVFPGHGKVDDLYASIDEIRALLKADLAKQLGRLSRKGQTVADLLARHNWDLMTMDDGTLCTIYFRVHALLMHLVRHSLAECIVGDDGVQRFIAL